MKEETGNRKLAFVARWISFVCASFSIDCLCLIKIHLAAMPSKRTQTEEIDQFRHIKIQPNTIDLSTRLWGINRTRSVLIPQSLVLRSIVLG